MWLWGSGGVSLNEAIDGIVMGSQVQESPFSEPFN